MAETTPVEPDNPSAYALARHIADHPVSTVQAAFRYLNAPLEIEVRDEPAAATVPAPAPADQAALRQQIAEALAGHAGSKAFLADGHEWEHARSAWYAHADAVLAVLPAPAAIRAAALNEGADAIDAETRQAKADGVLEPDKFRPCRDASAQLRALAGCQECAWGVEHTEHCPYPESHNWGCGCPTDQSTASRTACPDPIECSHEAALGRAEAATEQHRLALSQALGLGTGAPWDAIRDRAAELAAAPADRAAILRAEADRIDETREPFPIAVQNGITWATAEMRRHAAECPQCGSAGACNGGPCPLLPGLACAASGPGRADDETQRDETHRCSNCDGIDPDTCLTNPARTQQDETQPQRGDAFEAWLKAQRDQHDSDGTGDHEMYDALDNLLDEYRLHADTGTPLREHVCEARAVGDCDCLEQSAAVSQPDGEA